MRASLIGAGRIGGEVIRLVQQGEAPGWVVDNVLVRRERRGQPDSAQYTTDPAKFFDHEGSDIIIELAGPSALNEFAMRALSVAETWSISASALANPAFEQTLYRKQQDCGHKFRVLAGAFGGLDMVEAACVDPMASVTVTADVVDRPQGMEPKYIGTARDVVSRFDGINVVAAIALAGIGLDGTTAVYYEHVPGLQRRFSIQIESRYGTYSAAVDPSPRPGPSAVVASIIQSLREYV